MNGKIQKVTNPLYANLTVEREAAKKLLVERTSRDDISASDLEKDLDRYMGTIGGISANVGMNKVISYYDDIDLENEANLNDGGIIVIENGDLSVIINQNNNVANHLNLSHLLYIYEIRLDSKVFGLEKLCL